MIKPKDRKWTAHSSWSKKHAFFYLALLIVCIFWRNSSFAQVPVWRPSHPRAWFGRLPRHWRWWYHRGVRGTVRRQHARGSPGSRHHSQGYPTAAANCQRLASPDWSSEDLSRAADRLHHPVQPDCEWAGEGSCWGGSGRGWCRRRSRWLCIDCVLAHCQAALRLWRSLRVGKKGRHSFLQWRKNKPHENLFWQSWHC